MLFQVKLNPKLKALSCVILCQLFSRRFRPLFLRHLRQALYLFNIELQPFSNTRAVFWVGLAENGGLAQLDAFEGITEVRCDVANEMAPIHIGHDPSVKLPGLEEIVVGRDIRLTGSLPRYLERWLAGIRVRFGATETVGIVVRCIATVIPISHMAVALVVIDSVLREVNGQQLVVGAQPMEMCIVVREEPAL